MSLAQAVSGRLERLARLRRLPLIQPLAGRDFRLVWAGEIASLLGDNVYFVALTWLTVQLTGSGLALGSVLTAAAVPRAIFMVVGGALSDRFSPRTLMLVSNAARAALVAGVAILAAEGGLQLWHLYLLAGAFGLVDAFFYPAAAAIVPSLVDRESLAAGNALMRGTVQFSGLVGPALGGVLVAAVGSGVSFAAGATGFTLAAVTLALIGRRPRSTQGCVGVGTEGEDGREVGAEGGTGLLSSIWAGLHYAWADPVIRAILLAVAAVDFAFVGPVTVGLASLADGRFDAGSVGFGTMLSGLGGGALLGTLIAGSLSQPRRRGWLMAGMVAAMGVGLAFLGLAPSVAVATGLIAAMGVGAGVINVMMPTWLQTRADPRMLGRVMSLVMFASAGLAPLSYAIAGALVDLNATVLFAAAGSLVLLSAILTAANPAVRAID